MSINQHILYVYRDPYKRLSTSYKQQRSNSFHSFSLLPYLFPSAARAWPELFMALGERATVLLYLSQNRYSNPEIPVNCQSLYIIFPALA